MTTRRLVISRSAVLVGAASTGLLRPSSARAQSGRVRVGLMLPYTGTYAQLGVAIENGVRMAIDQQGGLLGGRAIEWFKVDDESEPGKGVENASKLVQRDKVDVLIGTVHSVQGANAVKGDLSAKPALYKALEAAVIDSPRGKWRMSRAHNPVQDIYLRRVENGENKVIRAGGHGRATRSAGPARPAPWLRHCFARAS
ncbi:hypothetical protein D5038_16445 [Verminephrobacter aporrectodeae subsp. tuberculatae]|uniref:ABC transporter substrate-binding protein n=1 Tax=Verminephrobacter aporrectodeae TaxID=1110389 RepID=UPI002238CB53|nr:ABC transporter substrate-binding protein [Verminephrobacter aporrectodeae]MCW5257898.1 hypothetical protein [Verminephrobacter aporrectodeae subsp. tuberculatae]